MRREKVLTTLKETGIMAIIRALGTDQVEPVFKALIKGGIRMAEITFDQSGKVTEEETAEMIRYAREHFSDDMVIGAGTVVNKHLAKVAYKAGAEFIVSPNVDTDVIRYTVKKEMVSIPGALTPTEIVNAENAGADVIKLFPAGSFGPSYIKAISSPLSNVSFVATGGVGPENMEDFYKVGVRGFGVGGSIISKEALKNKDYEAIERAAREHVEKWNSLLK